MVQRLQEEEVVFQVHSLLLYFFKKKNQKQFLSITSIDVFFSLVKKKKKYTHKATLKEQTYSNNKICCSPKRVNITEL